MAMFQQWSGLKEPLLVYFLGEFLQLSVNMTAPPEVVSAAIDFKKPSPMMEPMYANSRRVPMRVLALGLSRTGTEC